MMEGSSSEKKNAFDGLDREDLIRKCKALLGIAQKAKKAKEDLTNEVTALKEKLTECDTQKQADKDCLKTMQLMIDSLTDNKLVAANKIADLEKSNKNLHQQIVNCDEKLSKLSDLEIENEAQLKQIKRLTEENEEQEMDLKKLDERFAKVSELSKRQTQELLVLEQSVDRWKALEVSHQKLEEENKELHAKLAVGSNASDTDANVEEKIDVIKEKLYHENEQLKKEQAEQKIKLNKYKSKVIEFSQKFKEIKESKVVLQQTVHEYSMAVSKWQIQISHASKLLLKEVNELNAMKKDLEEQLKCKDSKFKCLEQTNDELNAKLRDITNSNASNASLVMEKYENLLCEYKLLEADIQTKSSDFAILTKEWETMVTKLKVENEKYHLDIAELQKVLESKSQSVAELEEKKQLTNGKNDELLAEMRELNEILKTRGNLISKQTAEIDQLKLKLEEQSTQIVQLEENLKEKMRQINQFETQSDVLSTSTISRADEIARMRDVEDSFEEKYNKLRSLAMKLKKKVADQQAIITKLESNSPPTPSTEANVSINIQNLKILQTENDKLLDKIDNMTIERKKYKSEIEELNRLKQKFEQEVKSLKIMNEDIKATADTNQRIKSALDEQIKVGEKQIDALKNDNRNVSQQLKNAENEIIKIKDQVKQKEAEIGAKMQEISKLKADLNKVQNSIKKNNVLNLEVEAYEKSLKEISEKLESQVKQYTEAREENEKHKLTIQLLQNDVQRLNNELELEKQNSNDLQQHNDLQKIKLKDNNTEIIELKRAIDDHVKETNTIKIELANLQSQQSENEIEKQKFVSKLKSEKEKNVAKIFALEEEVHDLKTKLNGCEQQLDNIQTEFASYKVRAQSVLRQSQTKDSSNDEEFKEEMILLQRSKDDLMVKLDNSNEQQRHLQHTIDELKDEKQNIQERNKKLLQLIEETRQQIDTLQNENRKQTLEHQEALKTHRLQVDTLNNCFKTQIDELKQKHDEDMAELKSKTLRSIEIDGAVRNAGPSTNMPMTDEHRIELIMMERQAGEGSESTTSGPTRKISQTLRNRHELIPLDELLNNSFEEEQEINDDFNEFAIKDTVNREKLAVQQRRVKHLSSLLSEAEMNVTRLTEMNNMLKEELRRQERSIEREKHMHNLEYMKNVIFKFLTINNADERSHLVPVLNIILKLSPDEVKQLQNVARGSDGGPSNWSNLLPAW